MIIQVKMTNENDVPCNQCILRDIGYETKFTQCEEIMFKLTGLKCKDELIDFKEVTVIE